MHRVTRHLRDELPPGFERVLIDDRAQLLLPAAAAGTLRQTLQHRDLDADAGRKAAEFMRLMQAEKQGKAATTKRSGAHTPPERRRFSAQPRKGWYRVLPKIADIQKAVREGRSPAGHSDKEVTDRLKAAYASILRRGPDRRFTVPARWREGLQQLEAELPHFRQPIELARASLALAEATGKAVRIPPILLLGAPGVGKTYFSHQLATVLGVTHGELSFDQPSYGGQLRGTDSAWSNTQTGLLFNLVCEGDHANPVILLDEVDKASSGGGRHAVDPIAQLHSALEPESARRIKDSSVHIEFDASMVTYVATANSLRGIGGPVLSRFEVFTIEPPSASDAVCLARTIVAKALARLGLAGRIGFDRLAIYLLAHLSARQMSRAVERALAGAVVDGRPLVLEEDVWATLPISRGTAMLH